MGIPRQYRNLELTVKYNLMSYLACSDCKYAVERLKKSSVTYSTWKVEWAGICALLKTSVHLMNAKDAKSCLPDSLKTEMKKSWNDLLKNKNQHPLFWNLYTESEITL